MSYYDILGIDKSASSTEIKKAFRKKATEWHPDKNPDKEAKEKFQQIANAYEVLSDEERKRIYDQHGEEGLKHKGPAGNASDINDILNNMFGGGGLGNIMGNFMNGMGGLNGFFTAQNNQTQRHNLDISFSVDIPLKIAFKGGILSNNIKRQLKCITCYGTGFKDKISHDCSNCKGSGKVTQIRTMGPFQQVMTGTCQSCNGLGGDETYQKCKNCMGQKVIQEEYTLKTKIPKGIENNGIIKLQGKGNQTSNGDSGDIIITIILLPDLLFTRVNNDLVTELRITPSEALCGFRKIIQHIDNKELEICVSNTLNNGQIIRYKNQGIENESNGTIGDLVFKIIIIEQKKYLSEAEKRALHLILTGSEKESNIITTKNLIII